MPDEDALPGPTPGPELEAQRRKDGVRQKDLAKRLGIGRLALHRWEREPELDTIRAARYRRALRELVNEATEGAA